MTELSWWCHSTGAAIKGLISYLTDMQTHAACAQHALVLPPHGSPTLYWYFKKQRGIREINRRFIRQSSYIVGCILEDVALRYGTTDDFQLLQLLRQKFPES